MAEELDIEFDDERKLPEIIPILPLADNVLFPKMVLPLVVTQDQYIQLVDEAMTKDRMIGFIAIKNSSPKENYNPEEDFYHFGTIGLILKMAKADDKKKTHMLVQGLERFKVTNFLDNKPYIKAPVEYIKDKKTKDKEIEALMSSVLNIYIKITELSPALPKEFTEMARSIIEPGILSDFTISTINSTIQEKQKILETQDIKDRLTEVYRLSSYQLEILELGNKIQNQVKGDMDKKQREYYLRQQMKAIQDELGEGEEKNVEIEELRAKIKDKNLPEEAKKEADRELNRLARMHPSSSEYTVSSTYLDWLTSLPWNESTPDILDIKKAKKILDEDHFGLIKAKKRIIEYLAVRKLKPDSKGPILCFVGPPGTGKTSLGRSIARALERKFVRISLGGVRDEAEIRGHRRTYVGALPGRVIQGIRRAGSNNPVFMLDEIDKVGSDFRGDPSAALLEVLDPEQNNSFSDHYLDVSFDLSKVMFITTANVLHTIPHALKDRMEVLELLGYTEDEKVKIASRYLIPRQREAHGLKEDQIKFKGGSVRYIISNYTREAGLRNFEREIATICRGVASKIAQSEETGVEIDTKNIASYLGPIKFYSEVSSRTSTPGVVTGLAWTQTGGDLLFIEATAMRGGKGLTLTGQLGDVMKESASAALSFIRSNAKSLGVPEDFFEKHDIHIHVPAGAIPKDGPSAGVTMLTALYSLLTNKLIKKNLAMTGEITLRGQVLAVGGIKEKVLAAHRAGIKTILLPKWNEKDLEEVPKKVKDSIKFVFVDKMSEVLKKAIEKQQNVSL
ncbi:MAG: endopeptidase La [Desulfobacterales bacterium]|nr:endopeptidase La [Desulfobacterales bacterium]